MWKDNFKTLEDAYKAIFEALMLNPACAGNDGFITLSLGTKLIRIKPRKNEKNNEQSK